MKMQTRAKITGLIIFLTSTSLAQADTVIVNNNNNPPAPAQPTQQCNNSNNTYDPRVPPAGSYVIKNSDGSSQNLYTTGEKKPFYVDNNCNNQQQVIQPNVWTQRPYPRRR